MNMHKKIILTFCAIIGLLIITGIIGGEYYTSRPSFCGSCHIMKNYYESWKKDKHSELNITCVDCHYPPGEKHALKSKFKGLGQLFTYLGTGTNVVRTPAKVSDLSCKTSECHPNEKFMDKRIQYTEKIFYVHNTHIDKTIEGQSLHCDTCHQHIKSENHFEVPKAACYLCHFKGAKLNEGRAKCSFCHVVPEKPLNKIEEGAEPPNRLITHKTLEEAKVPCHSCHYQIVQGRGDIKKEACFNCHEYSEGMLKKADDKKIMHDKHVGSQEARCFDCHMPIEHKEVAPYDAVLKNCSECHPEPHIYQKMILAGTGGIGIDKPYPIAHFEVKVNCLACHVEEGFDLKGRKYSKGSSEACTKCHLKDQEKKQLAEKWQDDVREALQEARDLEKEALEAIENAKSRVSAKTLRKAQAKLKDAQTNLRIADAGGGVHNKKYAMLLIDTALTDLETIIEELEDK